MKIDIVKTKVLRAAGLVAALILPATVRATDATWVNNGTIVTAPNIDAVSVINEAGGVMNFVTSLPFETSNTRNYTNGGTMFGSVGWRFDNAPRNSSGQLIGERKPADNFYNRSGASVVAQDGLLPSFNLGSYLLIQASNVINQGSLGVGAAGLLQIKGNGVNLSRSGLEVFSIIPTGAAIIGTNYFPDIAIYDNWWGQTNLDYNTAGILNVAGAQVIVIAPPHPVENQFGGGTVQFGLFNPVSAGYTNIFSTTNYSVTNITGEVSNLVAPASITRQAAFVSISDPTLFSASIHFLPSSIPTNVMRTVAVQLDAVATNIVIAQNEINSIYFMDALASETNRGVVMNASAGTSIPANYLISRQRFVQYGNQVLDLGGGVAGNTDITPDFLYATNFVSPFALDQPYAGYSATVDYLTSPLPAIPSATVTNQPGRLEVTADALDVSRARLRAQGYLSLQTSHLISSSNALMDCQNLNFNLASTNGLLRIQNLARETVQRLQGDILVWSGLWTNSMEQLIENYAPDPNDTNTYVLTPITNTVAVTLHAFLLDASSLEGTVPVTIYDLVAKSTNVVMSDSGVVAQKFLIDGLSFTLTGRLTLTGTTPDWTTASAPTLRYFTNSGTLNIDNEAHFGDDGAQNYLAFVNRGTISSLGRTINSDYTELGGNDLVGSSLNVITLDGKVESGKITTQGDTKFWADTLKFNQAVITSQSRVYLSVTNSLYDNGGASSNLITTLDGFYLTRKPATGDLLGTEFDSVAAPFALVNHYWAGRDDGANKTGFVNNTAMGRLRLVPSGVDPLFVFNGVEGTNGLYVDLLDLSGLTDYANQIQINPGLTIYYAAAKLAFTPPNNQTPEEYLNGQFDGHLRWVPDFTGPNSSVDVIINGNQTIQVNKALRNSTTIDSDSDGIPNFYDLTPFDGVQITSISSSVAPSGFELTWLAAPNTVYLVEYRTNLTQGVWMPLMLTTNSAATSVPWSVVDTNTIPANEQRYYRVLYNPNGP